MKENKKIDQLFKEQLHDFEATPNEQIWKNIESSLQEKKIKRRILPFWWKLSGIAALVAVGFFIGKQYTENYKNEIQNEHEVQNDGVNSKNQIVTKATFANDEKDNQKATVSSSKEEKNKIQNQVEKPTEKLQNKPVVSNSNHSKSIKNHTTTTLNSSEKDTFYSEKTVRIANNESRKSSNDNPNSLEKETGISPQKKDVFDTTIFEKQNQITKNKSIDKLQNDSENKNIENKLNSPENKNLSETIVVIPESKIEVQKTNELQQLLVEKEKDKKEKNPSENIRWQLATTVAPIFFGSSSNDSPVDAKFNNNSKTYENSISYGVSLQYSLTKKLAIRAGINKLNLDYTTNDVTFLENTQSVESLVAVSTENTIQFESQSGLSAVDGFTLANNTVNKGTLRQEFGYYEIPFELSYAVIDKKFKVNLITGLSTLFLDENNISLTSTKYNQSIGEANNLNKINFSTNVGLGFNYNIYKSFYLNLDSILKYQLNTFSTNSGSFKPYIVGFYSGISYKF
jgi:hypothetical protein